LPCRVPGFIDSYVDAYAAAYDADYVATTGEVAHGAVYSCDYVVDNGGELKGAPLRLSTSFNLELPLSLLFSPFIPPYASSIRM